MRLVLLFIRERISWILFFVLLQLWLNLLLYLDISFQDISLAYMNAVNFGLFLAFLLWRYFKETKFLRELLEMYDHQLTFDQVIAKLPKGQSVFEKIMMKELQSFVLLGKQELNDFNIKILEEKDQTLSWIHEMKTPLTSMKLMLDNVEDLEQRKRLEVEWLRMHMLLDQQLHNTRLPYIEKDTMIEDVNIQKVVYQEIKDLMPWCRIRNIGFETIDLDQKTLTDQKWLSFIVRQLVSNAVKYSKENSEILIYVKKDTMGRLILSVKDEGTGISEADLPRIFEKSFTGRVGRESTASSGMGLYLARNAAEKLGIKITVISKVNVGSTFSLQFPLKNEMLQILGR